VIGALRGFGAFISDNPFFYFFQDNA